MNLIQRLSSILTLALVIASGSAFATPQKINGLYVNAFGDHQKQAVIFVHGGPGYNSNDFEITTAQTLANDGFYVVVYDQRGQGRSDEAAIADFNYRRYADDLKNIIDALKLTKPILIGHSHGGPISLKFDQFYPGIVKSIVLVSAPINFWGSMRSLFENCANRYSVSGQQDKLDSLTYAYYQIALNPSATPAEKTEACRIGFCSRLTVRPIQYKESECRSDRAQRSSQEKSAYGISFWHDNSNARLHDQRKLHRLESG